jgi:hypothetical protein
MNCAACGAPRNSEQPHCAVCGRTDDEKGSHRWDRAPEALLFENLQPLLRENETLMSATRGRIGGSWRSRVNFSPFAFMAPYANLGLTGDRILIQQVHPKTGEGVASAASDIPLSEIASIQASDADPFEPGHTVRLTVLRNDGESFRVKAVGRLAEAATEMAEVWQTIAESSNGKHTPEERCEACGRTFGRAYRFCPFCGSEQGA